MDKLAISKAAALAAVPFAKPGSEKLAALAGGLSKSLTVKLDAADYWALRDFCTKRERETGQRVTHQEVMVMGLRERLERAA
jgi:hypothetical protein